MEQIVVYNESLKSEVFKFTDECFAEIGKAFEPDGRHSFYNDIEKEFDCFWCLLTDEKVTGTVGIRKEDDTTAELKAMYLSKELRGKGYGYKLLDLAMTYSKEKGYKRVVLDSMSKYEAALKLYEKYGFKRIDRYNDNQKADVFMEYVFEPVMDRPAIITDNRYRFDSFSNGEPLPCRGPKRLPAMGWNSWNPFGSNNNEELTRAQADKIIELGLDKFGYKYVVLDDGCYSMQRVNGKLVNHEERFPGGLNAISDYIHGKGLKFGMYNDIGTNLCGGAAVGTHGHEKEDAESYRDWDIDYIKVDNCYYMWDNATFADPENAKYSYAPNIKNIKVTGPDFEVILDYKDLTISGTRAQLKDGYITAVGTFDGTAPDNTPIGSQSSEVSFNLEVPCEGEYKIAVNYATGKEEGIGQWLQIRTEQDKTGMLTFDDMLPETESPTDFKWSEGISIRLSEGINTIRLMNHRRQENTLVSYATLLEEIRKAMPGKDIVYSICEWGKTMPSDWGYKVGDSWRILNDITFAVGSPEGDYGTGQWFDKYTNSITSQYNKCVIMDEFASLERGWNDPDMLMIGMNGLTPAMNRTHMSMWCMMNAPLMLGLDLRRVEKGDDIYKIITNEYLIGINQDPLGIQAKRVFTTYPCEDPSKEYIRDINRVDVLAKPLSGGRLAVAIYNLSDEIAEEDIDLDLNLIAERLGSKFPSELKNVQKLKEINVWNGDSATVSRKILGKPVIIEPYGNVTLLLEGI